MGARSSRPQFLPVSVISSSLEAHRQKTFRKNHQDGKREYSPYILVLFPCIAAS
jgi:hypothetical protein